MSIPVPEKRVAEFENFGFGMFIHWGLYSQLGQGEWVMNIANIPKDEYKRLASTFTASKFDARKIAASAKAAGMKYITLTTRHHDGFSLYDTKGLCDYDAPHTPAGRDLVREFVEACREFGLSPIFYHTTLDWYQDSFNDDFPAYLQYLRDSVEVLCTSYGKIGGLWFDGDWSKNGADWEHDKLYGVIRKHQPDAIIVNNTGLSARGALGNREIDSVTFEQGRPEPMNREGMEKYVAAEMCHTMNDHWGYGSGDLHYKSLGELIETLCACRRVGANYLLNVGPDAEGEIIPMQEAMLGGLGYWVKNCGQSIYRAKPCSVTGEGKNFALYDGECTYLYIHDMCVLGDANVTVGGPGLGWKMFYGVNRLAKRVSWTDNDETLEFEQDGTTLKMNATGFPYGKNFVVRVAKIEY